MTMEEAVVAEKPERGKKPRKRMRAVYSTIKEQMEFYFSDSNLHKDRFLKKTIDQSPDGFIELSVFTRFNRIKAITESTDVIADALSRKSSMLQVSEDKTKVKRITPICEPKNLDERTVYVECLPHGVDHQWITKLFTSCGKVLYVSLPRYPSTGDLKGFAFVEFEKEDDARKACEELNNPPAESENKLGIFPKTSKTMEALKKKVDPDQVSAIIGTETEAKTEIVLTTANSDAATNTGKPVVKRSRRRRANSESSIEGGNSATDSPFKRKRMEVSFEIPEGSKSEDNEKTVTGSGKKRSKKRKQRSKTLDSTSSTDENVILKAKSADNSLVTEDATDKTPSPKKRRTESAAVVEANATRKSSQQGQLSVTAEKEQNQQKKKRRKRKKKQHKAELPELRVIPKKQWLDLRTEYLKLQKESMNKLKESLAIQKEAEESEKAKMQEQSGQKKGKELEFVPAVIVKISSENPLIRKKLEAELPDGVDVAYMDIKDGLCAGHIRCKDAASAQKLATGDYPGYNIAMVTGEDEKNYWEKLKADREHKFSTKIRCKKRGHQKLMDRAQKACMESMGVERKHIVFGQDKA